MPKKDLAPLAVSWPVLFENAADKPNTRWIILKVDQSLDWRAELEGARLHLSQEVKLKAPSASTPAGLHARLYQDGWRQHLVLRPQEVGSERLSISASAAAIVQVTAATAELKAMEEASKAADAKFAEDAKRRAEIEAPSREYYAKRAEETRKLCSMSPLEDTLKAMGWMHGVNEDDQEAAAAAPDHALPAEAAETHPEPMHLKPVPAEEVPIPLAFWSACPSGGEEMKQVSFRRFAVGKQRTLVGEFAEKNKKCEVKLLGARAKHKKSALAQRYLIGAQSAGSKKVFIQEAELYRVDVSTIPAKRKVEMVEEEEELMEGYVDGPNLTYGEQRGVAVNQYGTVKKQRIRNLAIAKRATEHKVADYEKYNQALNKRALELEAAATPLNDRIEAERRKNLPFYDEKAEQPHRVYMKGLEQIAPLEALEGEPSFMENVKPVRKMLMQSPETIMGAKTLNNLPDVCRSCIAREAISAWARERSKAAAGIVEKEAAERMALKLICLHHMLKIFKGGRRMHHGKCSPQAVATLSELPADSAIVKHWHKVYYDEMLGQKKVRAFNGMKLLFAIMIWALHLTPGLAFELPGEEAEEELNCKIQTLQKRFEYVGCTVTKKEKPLRLEVKLKGPPKSDLAHYEAQSRKESEGSKKRGR